MDTPTPIPSPFSFAIRGMSCAHCVKAATEALLSVPNVDHAAVDLASEKGTIEHHGATVEALRAALDDAGFEMG